MIFAAVSKAIVFQKGSLFETIVVCWSSFQRFTNTNTMTVLTGGSQYIYHEGELPDRKPVETHKETRWAVKSLRNMPLRSCSHTKKVWERIFISTVRPNVHTNPSRENGAFRKRSSNRKNFYPPALRRMCDFPASSSLKRNSKMTGGFFRCQFL